MAGVLAALGAGSALAGGPAFLGNWARGDGKTRIRVERCGSKFCGVNTWVEPGVKSEKVGDRLIANIKPSGPERWSGTAYDPQRKRQYTFQVQVADNRLTTEGCALGGLLCQSMHWTRFGGAK